MHIRDFIGRSFSVERIKDYSPVFLPDDYDSPCYRIVLPSSNYVESVEGYYYLEVLVDSNSRIQKIWRNKEDFFANTILSKFPPVVEQEAEEILRKSCEDK